MKRPVRKLPRTAQEDGEEATQETASGEGP